MSFACSSPAGGMLFGVSGLLLLLLLLLVTPAPRNFQKLPETSGAAPVLDPNTKNPFIKMPPCHNRRWGGKSRHYASMRMPRCAWAPPSSFRGGAGLSPPIRACVCHPCVCVCLPPACCLSVHQCRCLCVDVTVSANVWSVQKHIVDSLYGRGWEWPVAR